MGCPHMHASVRCLAVVARGKNNGGHDPITPRHAMPLRPAHSFTHRPTPAGSDLTYEEETLPSLARLLRYLVANNPEVGGGGCGG